MFQPSRTKIKAPNRTEPEQMPMMNEKPLINLRRTSSVYTDDEQTRRTPQCRRNRIQRRSDTVAIA